MPMAVYKCSAGYLRDLSDDLRDSGAFEFSEKLHVLSVTGRAIDDKRSVIYDKETGLLSSMI